MQAYRQLIKKHHPDKGGSEAAFAQLQDAFAVLSDPRKRGVYDAWAKELQFRYVQGVTAKVWAAACCVVEISRRFIGLGFHQHLSN